MSLEFLNNYNAQIMEDDMNYLREFLENVRKDPRVNNKMVVLTGPPMCGKTRLIEEIHQYMQEVYLQLPEYYEPILPLILLDGGLESLKKRDILYLKNLIIYRQSILASMPFGRDLDHLEGFIKIIEM